MVTFRAARSVVTPRARRPVIAAIEGPAVAGGMGSALCDFRVMARVLLWCLLPSMGRALDAAHRAPARIMGQKRALEIISRGARCRPTSALRSGYEYVTPKDGARAKAEVLAQEIARFPQVCVRADRRSAIKGHGMSVRDALVQEWYNGREALVKDGVAGASRFKDGMGRHGDFAKIR